MASNTQPRGIDETRVDRDLRFRQHPLWSVFIAGVATLAVVTGPVALRDPEFRAAAYFAVNPFTSVRFVVVTIVWVLACIIFIPVAVRVLRSAWTFEITPDRLVATRQFTRRRDEIPWGSIGSVTQLAPSLTMKGARLQFNRIEVADGTELLFCPLLTRYRRFVDELHRRVACRVFDPAPGWPGQS